MNAKLIHILILLGLVSMGAVSFYSVRGNTGLQFVIGVATSLLYVIWGIVHHALEGDLHKKVVVEYILIGAIAVLLLEITLGP